MFLYTCSNVTQVPSGKLLDMIDHYLHIVLKSKKKDYGANLTIS